MLKKYLAGAAGAALTMLLVPFLLSRGWRAPLRTYMQRELPGNVVFASAGEEYASVMVNVLFADDGQVRELSLYDYLCGVLCAEMSPEYELEALKAQAVAACSYTVYRMEGERDHPGLIAGHCGAAVCTDSAHCKGYMSPEQARRRWGADYFDTHYARITTAVNSVLGLIITCDGHPANAVFHGISSGVTESAASVWGLDVPYLVSVDSSADLSAPAYETSASFTVQELAAALSVPPEVTDPAQAVGEAARSEAGGVLTVALLGRSFTGAQVRDALALRSTNFDAAFADGTFTFTVRGYGHGVGMSQYGANEMAKRGADFREILTSYYTGVRIEEYDFSQVG